MIRSRRGSSFFFAVMDRERCLVHERGIEQGGWISRIGDFNRTFWCENTVVFLRVRISTVHLYGCFSENTVFNCKKRQFGTVVFRGDGFSTVSYGGRTCTGFRYEPNKWLKSLILEI